MQPHSATVNHRSQDEGPLCEKCISMLRGFIQAGSEKRRFRIVHVCVCACALLLPASRGIKVKSNTSVSVLRPAASIPLTAPDSYMELHSPALTPPGNLGRTMNNEPLPSFAL